jgi:hypothetical protein
MRVVLATVLERLELRSASGKPEAVARRNITFPPRRGPRVVADPRRGSATPARPRSDSGAPRALR